MSPRLLFIYAHPDDESFGVAGIARMYADQGADIALVTATRGDAGRAGEPPLCRREELPARREAELREAAAILGIGHVTLLDYVDKHLAEAPPDKIRRELVRGDPPSSSAGRRHVRSGRCESASGPHCDFAIRDRCGHGCRRSAVVCERGRRASRAAPALDVAGDAVGGTEVGRPCERAGRRFPGRHLEVPRHQSRGAARASHAACVDRPPLLRPAGRRQDSERRDLPARLRTAVVEKARDILSRYRVDSRWASRSRWSAGLCRWSVMADDHRPSTKTMAHRPTASILLMLRKLGSCPGMPRRCGCRHRRGRFPARARRQRLAALPRPLERRRPRGRPRPAARHRAQRS